MTIREARVWLRHAVKLLNTESLELKKVTRTRHTIDSPGQQAKLRRTQLQLTCLHAMLAYSRGRIHPVTRGHNVAFQRTAASANVDTKANVRWWIEVKGENVLGRWWNGLAINGAQAPSLKTIWMAVSLIQDINARAAAVQLAGPNAGYR